ncbi:hypothetical protein CFOL_v3_22788 [Cephalotus follicularis]|uniref:Hydroxyproline-rich glycoprotein family protein n=1 Tax=Cephalotus follicularis TaxID=3775 RepID=A0A1Q3CGX3_CEPFO|nr:hypothetical protein CFOL_v3_22788 [Cephalotus follicularis]
MRSVSNSSSVDTINAAATAIVFAESRVQPTTVQKRRWGSCWSLYWCFGFQKNSKRIGHAVFVPEPVVPGAAAPAIENRTQATAIVLPFIAPPSSPASFLQSDPPSATQTPAGMLSLTSLSVNTYSSGGSASIYSIGPYAQETQLVSPPTAPFTPPPESVPVTTPSSPEVPFAQLLASSLERARRNSGVNQKFTLSHYEFQSYQLYSGSPDGRLISPGSAMSTSGASTPFPDRRPILELRIGEAPKLLGFDYYTTHKWGSRLGSGSLTPDGMGLGSRLGSGSLTPDGVGVGSRLGSGSLTPAGACLGSGSLTPDGVGLASRDTFLLENQTPEIASLANFENECKDEEVVIDHRVSFELSGEDIACCLDIKPLPTSGIVSECPHDVGYGGQTERNGISMDGKNYCKPVIVETSDDKPEKASGETEDEYCYQKHRSITLGSTKEFNFDNTKGEVSDKPIVSSKWWANEKVAGKEARPGNNWTFFPMMQP